MAPWLLQTHPRMWEGGAVPRCDDMEMNMQCYNAQDLNRVPNLIG